MARQTGARTALAAAFETTYGTPPASGYKLMSFTAETLGMSQGLITDDRLGYGRDPQAPTKDVQTTDGDISIALEVENLGHWLKAAFGNPTTTGTTTRTHTFASGAYDLPSQSVEVQMPQVPSYEMFSGLVLNELSFSMARSGLLGGTVRLIGQGSGGKQPATAAGTPGTWGDKRFGHFAGSIRRNGTALAQIVSADVTYSNGLDAVATIRADGKIDGVDPGMASLTGRITARFSDLTLIDQASAGTPCELVFGHELSASERWSLTAHAVYLPVPRTPISGPGGIEATYEWQAAKAGGAPNRMATAVLVNAVTAY